MINSIKPGFIWRGHSSIRNTNIHLLEPRTTAAAPLWADVRWVTITLQANDTALIQHPHRILSHTEANQKQYEGEKGSTKERVDYGASQM